MNTTEFLDSLPYELYRSTVSGSVSEWANEVYQIWKTFVSDMTWHEYFYGKTILLELLQYHIRFSKKQKEQKKQKEDTKVDKEHTKQAAIDRIRSAPQVEQRTENWYKESLLILSGSQYATILKPGRTRGHLVLEKAGITRRETGGPNVVLSPQLNPFMWGIRFEPVVKQLYEALTNTQVVELGRLRHTTNPRLGASPDGLVIQQGQGQKQGQDRVGRFVEFKAPVTRQIFNKVPEEYNTQMQIQMEVGDVEECDYLEVKFNSIYKGSYKEPDPTLSVPPYQGNIFVIEKEATVGQEFGQLRYAYSPINDMKWMPVYDQDEQILETVPWYTNEWYLTTVPRSREWYQMAKIKEDEFWRDVEGAKAGTWTLPESSRKPKEKAEKSGKAENAEKNKMSKYAFVDSENEKAI